MSYRRMVAYVITHLHTNDNLLAIAEGGDERLVEDAFLLVPGNDVCAADFGNLGVHRGDVERGVALHELLRLIVEPPSGRILERRRIRNWA